MWGLAKFAARLGLSGFNSRGAFRSVRSTGAHGHVHNTGPKSSAAGKSTPALIEARLRRQEQNTPSHVIKRRAEKHAILSRGRCSNA